MIQDIGFIPPNTTVQTNSKSPLATQPNSRTNFRDILAANRPSSIFNLVSTDSERDKPTGATPQARALTPPTSTTHPATTTQPTTDTPSEPEYSISIVNNLRPYGDNGANSANEIQIAHLFLVPFQSAATISLSKLFEFSLAGDEDGIVKVTNTQINVQWHYQLCGEDREFIESLNARIQALMQSQESIKNATDRYHNGENLTKDEILDGIIAQYANTPITMTNFRTLLFDMYSKGALSDDEVWLVSRWGGLGIEVVAEEYEYQAWLRGIQQDEHDEPLFTTPDLLEQFLKMLEESRNASAVEAAKQEDNDKQNRDVKDKDSINCEARY